MLSTGAFNALLKTLEEPPAHAIFILATTEPHRLPATILSRCQRYDFKRISEASIVKRLSLIANNEGIRIDAAAIRSIALLADGALRDAISLLDQAKISFPDGATQADIQSMTGQVDRQFLGRMVTALVRSDAATVLFLLDQMIRDGQDMVRFAHELAAFYRDLLIIHAAGDTTALQSGKLAGLITASDAEIQELKNLAAYYQQPEVVERITQLSALISDMRWSPNPRILLEIGVLRLMGTRAAQVAAKQVAAPDLPAPVPEVKAPAVPAPVRQEAAARPSLPKGEEKAQPNKADNQAFNNAPEDSVPVEEIPMEDIPVEDSVYDDAFPEEAWVEPPYEEEIAEEKVSQVLPPAEPRAAAPVRQDSRDTSLPAVKDKEEARVVWNKILDRLQKQDMFCFLFAKTAEVDSAGGELLISFASEEKANYNVFSTDRGNKPLRDAMRECLGHMIPYRVVVRGTADGKPPTDQENGKAGWQEHISRAAQSLGIPIERKDS